MRIGANIVREGRGYGMVMAYIMLGLYFVIGFIGAGINTRKYHLNMIGFITEFMFWPVFLSLNIIYWIRK